MAEEGETSIEETEEAVEGQKSPYKKFIVIGAVLLLLGGGAFGGWYFFLAGKPSQEGEKVVTKTEQTQTGPGIMHEMEPFIVNLLDRDGKRYLKAKLELEVENEDIKNEVQKRRPQLRDTILLLLASKSFDDISSPEGKIELRSELVSRINQVLKSGAIQALYFTEFVVQ